MSTGEQVLSQDLKVRKESGKNILEPIPKAFQKLRSNLSDEKVVAELDGILSIVQARNVSKPSSSASIPSQKLATTGPSIAPQPKTHVDQNLVQLQEQQAAYVKGWPIFELWLQENNLSATHVSGHDFNCFIYSLLQHTTGQYDKSIFPDELVDRIKIDAGINPNSVAMRYDDTEESLNIVKAVNKLYQVSLEVHFIQIDVEGLPIVLPPLFDKESDPSKRQKVLLLKQVYPLHYVAIISASLSELRKKFLEEEQNKELKRNEEIREALSKIEESLDKIDDSVLERILRAISEIELLFFCKFWLPSLLNHLV